MSKDNAELVPYRPQEPNPEPGERPSTHRSRLGRAALPIAACAAVVATAAAVALAASGSSHGSVPMHPQMPPMEMGVTPDVTHPSPSPYGAGREGMVPPSGNSPESGSGSPAGSDLATTLGQKLAGNGQEAVPLSTAEALGNQRPGGAQVDLAAKTVRFTTSQVNLVIVASPPEGDMKFRIAGMNDPTIEVPANAQVTVRFINGDKDMAHMWLLEAGENRPETFQPGGHGGQHIAAAPPLGDPTSAGQAGETISFSAPEPGSYHYVCPFPGHAEEGMYGRFVVRS
ncbi:MAG TPA: sulfocyanin-like copper-binding protein [Solirubrobacteraceae bacterium]|nr:sulfocyanin-like copper-binding protein [Solirubrobacteraceae bacterium]